VFLILIRVSPSMFQVSGARSADRRLDSGAHHGTTRFASDTPKCEIWASRHANEAIAEAELAHRDAGAKNEKPELPE
jgi:hypothetical protein